MSTNKFVFFITIVFLVKDAFSQHFSTDSIDLKFSGYIQFDSIASRTSYGDFTSHAYLPNFDTSNSNQSGEFNFLSTAKYSRFSLEAQSMISNQAVLGFYEIDFNTNTGSEVVTNSFQPRLRQVYIKINKLTIGQTFSTFFNGSAFPETFDFVGPAESVSFIRQPLVRYSGEKFSISFENPETVLSGLISNTVYNDDVIPDFFIEWRAKNNEQFSAKIVAVYRYLNIDENEINDSTNGYGISVSGKYNFSTKDDLRFQMNLGSGIGRYVGLSLVAADVHLINNKIEAISLNSYYISFRHFWNEKIRSNFTVGSISVEESKDQNTSNIDTASSYHTNLIFQKPGSSYKWGVEYIHAKKKLFDSTQGDLDRIQVSLKYVIN